MFFWQKVIQEIGKEPQEIHFKIFKKNIQKKIFTVNHLDLNLRNPTPRTESRISHLSPKGHHNSQSSSDILPNKFKKLRSDAASSTPEKNRSSPPKKKKHPPTKWSTSTASRRRLHGGMIRNRLNPVERLRKSL